MHLKYRIVHLPNGTVITTIFDENNANENGTLSVSSDYDGHGAVYYVVVVILLYGFSIVLMIGSSIRKSQRDGGVRRYMKNRERIKQ